MSSFLSSILRASTRDRQAKAVRGLHDGTITVTLLRRTDNEIRAAVKNGHGLTYGVTLTERETFCSCPDALYHGTVCKHAIAVAMHCLHPRDSSDTRIHLMCETGAILCGLTPTLSTRFWRRWTLNALNWSDLVCQSCVHTWTHPTSMPTAA
jgi:hypothetical protein